MIVPFLIRKYMLLITTLKLDLHYKQDKMSKPST